MVKQVKHSLKCWGCKTIEECSGKAPSDDLDSLVQADLQLRVQEVMVRFMASCVQFGLRVAVFSSSHAGCVWYERGWLGLVQVGCGELVASLLYNLTCAPLG